MSYEVDVVIVNNSKAEPTEYFLAVLTPVEPLPENVVIRPAVANVTIVDGKFDYSTALNTGRASFYKPQYFTYVNQGDVHNTNYIISPMWLIINLITQSLTL